MLFSDLERITSGKISINDDNTVSRFSTDSRTLSGVSNEVFIATEGKRDGHQFIRDALDLGVKNFIVKKKPDLVSGNFLEVDNPVDAFQKIAAHHRSLFQIPIVGITGSNGKTIVKEWLSTLLSERFFVIKNPKSYNSQVGVPPSVLEIRGTHEVGVFEAGISTVGEMVNLEKIIQPTHGIFTTLGNAHSEGFEHDQQKLIEKLKLFENTTKVICRNDQTYSETLAAALGSRRVTWSTEGNADHSVSWESGGIHIDQHIFSTHFNSASDLENATHAIIMALELGVTAKEIQAGLKLIKPVPMRLELKQAINDSLVLDDTYNNDLQGLKVALDYLDSHNQKTKKTIILSDILQSGKSDSTLYAEVADLLREKKISRLIGVGPHISSFDKILSPSAEFFQTTEELLSNLPHFENEIIVVKGARNFELERVVKRLEKRTHGTVLEVNFEALQHNLTQYRNLLSPNTKLMVMVKANAYGSGILEVANFLQHQRVDQLGVAYVDEAILLRQNGIHLPIMIMNPHVESFQDFAKYNLEAEVFGIAHLKQLLENGQPYPKIHLKVDTGMHRLGFPQEEIPELLEILSETPNLEVAGVFTHFSGAENSIHDGFTKEQALLFERAYQEIAEVLGYKPFKHAVNSSGIVRWPQYQFDMVRLGIGLHGFDPTNKLGLRSTSQLKSAISQIRRLQKGETVGYGRKGVVNQESTIAVVPIGYEDGFLRVFGNGNGQVMVGGALCPTIGNICMDMMMLDVTGVEAEVGDEVIIFGINPTIQDLANSAGTIPYEILTNVSNRVKRVFIWE